MVDIHYQLCEVYGTKWINLCKWCREFKDGCTDIHDEQGSGQPLVLDEIIAKVKETMLNDWRVMIWELYKIIPDVSKTYIDKILTDHLGYAKVCVQGGSQKCLQITNGNV